MQIKIRSIIGVIIALSLAVFAYKWIAKFYKETPDAITKYVIDPEKERIIITQQKLVDSLILITQKRDTFIYEKIKYIPVKVNSAYTLATDSSLRLFSKWNSELEDSSCRAGYFRIGSDSLDKKR